MSPVFPPIDIDSVDSIINPINLSDSDPYLIDMEVAESSQQIGMELAEQIDVTVVQGTDVSDTTAVEADVMQGKKFHKADGSLAVGTYSIPVPENMITNGDFSQAGATTDGWSSVNPSRSTIAVTDGKLVLTHTTTNNGNYGVSYAVNTQADHIYYFRFKVARTIGGSDGDSAVIQIMLGSEIAYVVRGLDQNDIVESVAAYKTSSAESTLKFQFGGAIGTTAANDSMMELYYIEMYDVTDILPD